MAVKTAVDVLARMLDAYDSRDRSVHHVGATSIEDGGDALHVDLEVAVPVAAAGDGDVTGAPVAASVTEDGHVAVEYPTAELTSVPSPPEADVAAVPTSARVDGDRLILSMDVTITPTDDTGRRDRIDGDTGRDGAARADPTREDGAADSTDRGPSDHDARTDDHTAARPSVDACDATGATAGDPTESDGETAAEFAAVRDGSVPPYEDTPYLRAIYQRYDTFAEMREVIEMDVSTETVRRYMIDVGIHDPNSYGSTDRGTREGAEVTVEDRTEPEVTGEGDRADTDEPPARDGSIPDEHLVTDGIGLPEELSLKAVLEAVVDSSTVYEVTRALDLDQHRTREILEQLDLLELVMTRVADDHKRDVSYEDVADRLRRTASSA